MKKGLIGIAALAIAAAGAGVAWWLIRRHQEKAEEQERETDAATESPFPEEVLDVEEAVEEEVRAYQRNRYGRPHGDRRYRMDHSPDRHGRMRRA